MAEPLLEIVPPTGAGVDPFDEDPEGRYRCPCGHVLGLNRLSELWISVGRSEVPQYRLHTAVFWDSSRCSSAAAVTDDFPAAVADDLREQDEGFPRLR